MKETMCCFADRKFAQNGGFRRHFAIVWRRTRKVCREACHLGRRLSVKFDSSLPKLFQKAISYDCN